MKGVRLDLMARREPLQSGITDEDLPNTMGHPTTPAQEHTELSYLRTVTPRTWTATRCSYSAGRLCPPERCGRPTATLAVRSHDGRAMQGSSISAVRIERTAHPVPRGGVSADQRRYVVRGRVELPTFRFSGQPRQALCRPAKTDVTDKRNRARRKVQDLR
jgi:hypothetical protein